jgi:hypothetical protein
VKLEVQKMNPDARVWIYQSSAVFSKEHSTMIKSRLDAFVDQWAAHHKPLAAHGDVLHDRFVVLIVDERYNQASGCSIDASVSFVRALEKDFNIDLFDRMVFSYKENDTVVSVPKDQFAKLYQKGIIHDDTLVFDNLVNNKKDLEANWIKPLKDSWHRRFV